MGVRRAGPRFLAEPVPDPGPEPGIVQAAKAHARRPLDRDRHGRLHHRYGQQLRRRLLRTQRTRPVNASLTEDAPTSYTLDSAILLYRGADKSNLAMRYDVRADAEGVVRLADGRFATGSPGEGIFAVLGAR